MKSLIKRQSEILLLSGVMFAMVAVRLVMIASNFDPAYDQSMLLANFPLDRPSDILAPLYYFEQTTTLGHGLLLDFFSQVFGPEGMARINAIRITAAIAACAALWWLYLLLRRDLLVSEALVTIVLIGCSPLLLEQSVTAKHYIFEFTATVVLLGAARNYLSNPSPKSGLAVLLAGIFVSLFAFVAPIIIAAIGTAVLVGQAVEAKISSLAKPQFLRQIAATIGLGIALTVIAAGFYFGYTNVVTSSDLIAFSERDAEMYMDIRYPLSHATLHNALQYATYFAKFIAVVPENLGLPTVLARLVFASAAMVLSVAGIVALWKRSPFWVAAAITTLCVTLVLNFAQTLPFSGARQHLFAVPFFAPVMVVGFSSIVRWFADRLVLPRVANGLLLVLALVAIGQTGVSAFRKESVVPRLLTEIDASGDPVWAYYGAQPILRTFRPSWMNETDSPVIGQILHHTGTDRWNLQARSENDNGMRENYYFSSAQEISQHDKIWLVFSNWWFDVARFEGLEVFLQHARGPGRDCSIWRNGKRTLVAYCGPTDEVNHVRQRNYPDQTAEWNRLTKSGDWINSVKGEIGQNLREGYSQ